MYIIDGVAYAGKKTDDIKVKEVKVLDDMMMILTFTTGEQRLFDGSELLSFPAFAPLKDEKIFKKAKVEYGVVTWNNGEIDIAPETMYQNSYAYNKIIA